MIDFTPVHNGDIKFDAFAAGYGRQHLRQATNSSIDYLRQFFRGLTDADVTFDPVDKEAHDPYAVAGEEDIGWSIAHLVAHVTASSEEGAAIAAELARGVVLPEGLRLRYETPWREITTVGACIDRLEESRRIRLAYLETWPSPPHLDVYRPVSERFVEKFGRINAVGAFLFGLSHEVGHYGQLEDVKLQALAGRPTAD